MTRSSHKSSASILALLTALTAAACNSSGGGTAAPAQAEGAATAPAGGGEITDQDRTRAQEIYAQRCVACHGASGAGDGPASAGLTPRPRSFADGAWQDSTTDERIESIILRGGASAGLSAAMPNNPDLMSQPGVVRALREHVRSLRSH